MKGSGSGDLDTSAEEYDGTKGKPLKELRICRAPGEGGNVTPPG